MVISIYGDWGFVSFRVGRCVVLNRRRINRFRAPGYKHWGALDRGGFGQREFCLIQSPWRLVVTLVAMEGNSLNVRSHLLRDVCVLLQKLTNIKTSI